MGSPHPLAPRLRLVAALALGCAGAAAVLAASCAIYIGDLVVPHDAEAGDAADARASDGTAETSADAEPSDATTCMGQSCDADNQCCGSSPRCTNARMCAASCASLDARQCSPPECCLGLFCENLCRVCHDAGSICTTDNSCCNNDCFDSGSGLFCK